jgi:DNA ligase-1
MFANIHHEENGTVRITSRQGTEFPMAVFGSIEELVKKHFPKRYQYHGELLVGGGVSSEMYPREIGNGILNSMIHGEMLPGDDFVNFRMWDMIPLSVVAATSKHVYNMPYFKRFDELKKHFSDSPDGYLSTHQGVVNIIETRIVHSLAEAYQHASELMQSGKEGTIIKNPHAIWRDGMSKEQVKIKLEFNVDLKVVAIENGKFGTRLENRPAALLCASEDGRLATSLTIKNEAVREAIEKDAEDWKDRIISVTANDIMNQQNSERFSLFLPRMAEPCYRTDKTEADTIQRILEQKQAAIFGEQIREDRG